jgi:hypothetical protein
MFSQKLTEVSKTILICLVSPRRMFVETCQRLRLMKSSETVNLCVYFILLNLVLKSSGATFLHCLALNNWMGLIFSIPCSTKSL